MYEYMKQSFSETAGFRHLFQVAQRDQKFVSKMKLLNSVKVFHALLKQHYNNSKTLLPLLLIVKILAKNCKRLFVLDTVHHTKIYLYTATCKELSASLAAFSLQTLVKDGIVSTLEKTFVSVGYTPHLKLRTLLECFKHLTTNSTYVLRLHFPPPNPLSVVVSPYLSHDTVFSQGSAATNSWKWGWCTCWCASSKDGNDSTVRRDWKSAITL